LVAIASAFGRVVEVGKMKVWSVVSQKGGAGKTTLALQLAIAASKDLNVLVIDLDPQESAERWHGVRQSTTGLLDDPSIAAGPYQKLPEMLKTADEYDADLVLIDTPPKTDKAIAAAIKSSSLVLVPMRSGILDLQALADTAELIGAARARKKAVVVLNALPGGKDRAPAVEDGTRIAAQLKLPLMSEALSEHKSYGSGLKDGLGVTETESKNGKAAKEIRNLFKACWERDSKR
jgi:chromosome partitioning protein